jgi:serine/threonine-protein kinase
VPVGVHAPTLPPWLAAVIMRLLEKQPGDRYADAGALVRALELGEAGAVAAPPLPAAPTAAPAGFSASATFGVAVAPPAAAPVFVGSSPESALDRARWNAPPVVRFRQRLLRWGIVASAMTFFGLVGGSGQLLFWGVLMGIWAVRPYFKLTNRDGYDWRDVFRQPRDRLFFDVAADSIDNARALFDREKRTELRQKLRAMRSNDPSSWSALPPAPPVMAPLPASLIAAPAPGAAGAGGGPAPLSPPAASTPQSSARGAESDDVGGLATLEVLNGAHGAVVRRAAADRAAVRQEVARLGPADRALLPDVVPTVEALVVRIAALATALHRLDADLAPDALPELDKRIAGAEAGPSATPDRDRKLALLRRQRATLQDLADRRAALSAQLESAGLILQNIRFDLLRLRSAGVQSAIDDVTSATQEARALSREIGHVLNAAEELKTI